MYTEELIDWHTLLNKHDRDIKYFIVGEPGTEWKDYIPPIPQVVGMRDGIPFWNQNQWDQWVNDFRKLFVHMEYNLKCFPHLTDWGGEFVSWTTLRNYYGIKIKYVFIGEPGTDWTRHIPRIPEVAGRWKGIPLWNFNHWHKWVHDCHELFEHVEDGLKSFPHLMNWHEIMSIVLPLHSLANLDADELGEEINNGRVLFPRPLGEIGGEKVWDTLEIKNWFDNSEEFHNYCLKSNVPKELQQCIP